MSSTVGLDTRTATGHALLTASACALCLVIAAALDLEHADLAVWTTYLVMAQYAFSSFQKGVERIVGRALGILGGLVLTTWFNEMPLVVLGLIGVLLTGFFYLHFAGRMAYTFLQAGLYLVALFQIGHASPDAAVGEAKELFAAIVIGVVVADVVNWLAGVEGDVRIRLGDAPLWPVRIDWLNQSVMLAVTVLITLLVAHVIDLPPTAAAISVLVLTITPHLQALIHKGELRIAGLVLASIWGVGTFLLVGLLPYLPLLCVLVLLGQFIAAYLTLTAGKYSYAGLQMGLVLPMIVVARPTDFGNFTPAVQRLEGILIGLLASIAVASLWPRFPVTSGPPELK